MESTVKSENGSSVPAVVSKGTTTANNSASSDEIKVCHATDCTCTARKGYMCSHQGPCRQITGNNTEQPRCPDCGSIALEFGSRDPCEGDYYHCQACGLLILFPLNFCRSISDVRAARAEILRLMSGSVINADAAIASTPFADTEPFDAGKFVTDMVGS